MRWGVNWISPATLPIIRELIDEAIIDFCEIMVDNFIHLPSREILKVLSDVPIGLHIVASRFLEKSPDELKALGGFLRPWIKALNPLYVSDHLLTFSDANNRRLALINELDYVQHYAQIKQRILNWQTLLDTPLLFENHASLTERGLFQASFFKKLLKETDAQLLFDFSNAYIAEYNAAGDRSAWQTLLKQTKHFHVAGFRIDATSKLAIDTHDTSIDEEVLNDMLRVFRENPKHHDKTLIIEFDAKVNFKVWRENILRIKKHIATDLRASNLSVAPILNPKILNRDKQLSSLHDQNLYARVFKLTPQLLSFLKNNEHAMLHEFLNDEKTKKLKMDWTLHLHLLNWLKKHEPWQDELTLPVIQELIIASVTRFALSGLDHPDAKGILVASPYLRDTAIGLFKSERPHQMSKIVKVSFTHSNLNHHAYAFSYQPGRFENLQWQIL